MASSPRHVLFLCTGNSARSILAELALRRLGEGRFVSHSAGSQPKSAPHAMTLRVLAELGYSDEELAAARSKSWDEFSQPGAPELDFVFTVCGNAAGEVCPVWQGAPVSAHWGVEDPAAFVGPEEEQLAFFRRIYFELEARVKAFVALPLESLDAPALQARVEEIGRAEKLSGP